MNLVVRTQHVGYYHGLPPHWLYALVMLLGGLGLEHAICAAAEAAGLGADAYRRELLSVDKQSPLEKLVRVKVDE